MLNFNVGKSVLNSQNLLAGSTAVLLETLFWDLSCAKHWFKHFSTLIIFLFYLKRQSGSQHWTRRVDFWIRILHSLWYSNPKSSYLKSILSRSVHVFAIKFHPHSTPWGQVVFQPRLMKFSGYASFSQAVWMAGSNLT